MLGFTYMSNAEIEALKKELSLAMDQKNRALDLLSEAKKKKNLLLERILSKSTENR